VITNQQGKMSLHSYADDGAILFNSIQTEASLRADNGSGTGLDLTVDDLNASRTLVHQNAELRRRLDDEHSQYRRRLQTYQEGQQRQAQLIQKLQAKVITSYGVELERAVLFMLA
jgi:hypothetical protein